MTQEQQGQDAGKPAADDVAADMERRLETLGEHEGPLSGGATLSAAESHADEDDAA